MIVTRLNGGLGNQLFQYAFGRCLAERHGVPLYLDIRDYRHSPQHGLLINHFAIDAQFLDKELFSVVPDILRRSKWQRLMWNMNPAHVRWVREKPFGFQPRWLSLGKSVYLDGYWQSALFFDDIADMILKRAKPSSASKPMTEAEIMLQKWSGVNPALEELCDRLGLVPVGWSMP